MRRWPGRAAAGAARPTSAAGRPRRSASGPAAAPGGPARRCSARPGARLRERALQRLARAGAASSAAAVGVGARRSAARSAQRDVGLVADAADHRQRAGRHGAHHALVVEGPQVFQRAAAAHQQQHVHLGAQLPGTLQRRAPARPAPRRPAPGSGRRPPHLRARRCQRGQHVVQRRRAQRGDHADARGNAGSGRLRAGRTGPAPRAAPSGAGTARTACRRPARCIDSTTSCSSPRGSYTASARAPRPAGRRAGAKSSSAAARRNIAQRSSACGPSASFSVK
jgi:hypothetical protein